MADTEEPGQSGASEDRGVTTAEVTKAAEHGVDVVMFQIEAALYPPNLDEGGRREFARLMKEDARRNVLRMNREVDRVVRSLNIDGPVTFTSDLVRSAHKTRTQDERKELGAESSAALKAELAKSLQQAADAPEAAKLARNRWLVGTVMSTSTSATLAALSTQGGHVWVALTLVVGNVAGVLLTRPPTA